MAETGFARFLFPEASGRFRLPLVAYYITRTASVLTPLFLWLSALESKSGRRRTSQLAVERPVPRKLARTAMPPSFYISKWQKTPSGRTIVGESYGCRCSS